MRFNLCGGKKEEQHICEGTISFPRKPQCRSKSTLSTQHTTNQLFRFVRVKLRQHVCYCKQISVLLIMQGFNSKRCQQHTMTWKHDPADTVADNPATNFLFLVVQCLRQRHPLKSYHEYYFLHLFPASYIIYHGGEQ